MIIIRNNTRNKKQPLRVVTTGKNNEVLKTSETFKTKQAAWKNIVSDAKENYPGCTNIIITDATGKKEILYDFNIVTGEKKLAATEA